MKDVSLDGGAELPQARRAGPIPDSYWLIDGALLAGEYPGSADDDAARDKLTKFLDAGIRTFIDLTEKTEPLTRYDGLLRSLSAERGIETKHLRIAVRDMSVPHERQLMTRILDTISKETTAGRPVYVHCWGGIGRTGTVVGCWLVDSGMTGPDAIARIAALRANTPDSVRRSPETDAQRRYICAWAAEGERGA
ncbi:MAG: dual specificity protein phosphatase family protein [Acidobacteriota bacterium]